MVFYVIYTVLQVAKSLCKIYLEQVPQQVLQVGAKVRGKSYLQGRKQHILNNSDKLSKMRCVPFLP